MRPKLQAKLQSILGGRGHAGKRPEADEAAEHASAATQQQVTAASPDAHLQHFLLGVASAAEASMVISGNDPLSYFLSTVRAAALASAAMPRAPAATHARRAYGAALDAASGGASASARPLAV